MSAFLELYEPLDFLGNGSFGVVRKVRRKSDGLVGPLSLPPALHFVSPAIHSRYSQGKK